MATAEGAAVIPRSPAILHAYGLSVPLLVVAGIELGGWWCFSGLAFGFVANPLLDAICGNKFGESEAARPSAFRSYDLPIYLTLPLMLSTLVYALWFVAAGGADTVETAGVILSCGAAAGTASVTAGHELVHKPRPWQRGMGVALLGLVGYAHFRIAHVHGHHRHVATPRDAATARLGETVYGFVPRSIALQWRWAWTFEKGRLRRRGRALWGARNRMLWYTALPPACLAVLHVLAGPAAPLAFAGQAAVAILALEMANYLAHYGLERRKISPGVYEPTTPYHSWNSAQRATDLFFFGLGRHSAHHLDVSIAYPELGNLAAWPQHRAGYHTRFLLALFPPLWRRLMDPAVLAARAALEQAVPLSPKGLTAAGQDLETARDFV